jgi:predicted metal-dependent HD superfamily phosphohydrolase
MIAPMPYVPPDLVRPPGFLPEVRAAHATPPRAYHGWPHVLRVLDHVGEVAREVGWDQPREVWLAALFHDVVYVVGARDNEARSAALARQSIARWFPEAGIDGERVAALIELTARHGTLAPGDVDRDAALLLDCDLAVVGAGDEEVDRYDAGIAQEWLGVIELEAYRAGRRAFLSRLLATPRLFLSDHFHERLDARARANLRRLLARLDRGEGAPPPR